MTMQLKDMRLLKRNGYIDGRWVDADSGASFRVTDPASGQTVAEVSDMGVAETKRAIEAAARAQQGNNMPTEGAGEEDEEQPPRQNERGRPADVET